MTYQSHVTYGLLHDAIALLDEHGITRADDDSWRSARALEALCAMADAIAGPVAIRADLGLPAAS